MLTVDDEVARAVFSVSSQGLKKSMQAWRHGECIVGAGLS